MNTVLVTLFTVLMVEAVSLFLLSRALKNERVKANVRYMVNRYLGTYKAVGVADEVGTLKEELHKLKFTTQSHASALQNHVTHISEVKDSVENLSHSLEEFDQALSDMEDTLTTKSNKEDLTQVSKLMKNEIEQQVNMKPDLMDVDKLINTRLKLHVESNAHQKSKKSKTSKKR